MRKSIRRFAGIVSQTLPISDPVYEFGSYQVLGDEEIANIRPFFEPFEYHGCDILMGPGVDEIMDIQDIDLDDETVGTVLCFETLEHVERPWVAMQEVYRVLKPGGMVVVSAPMNLLIHAFPSDYWRFTTQGIRTLLSPFPSTWVGYAGVRDFPHTVLGIGFKGEPPALDDFVVQYKHWQSHQSFFDVAIQFLPVGVVPPLRWASRKIKHLLKPSATRTDPYLHIEGLISSNSEADNQPHPQSSEENE